MDDLYSLKAPSTGWRRACGGNTGDAGTAESCVEWARVPMRPDVYAVRDSKRPEAGTLMFTRAELDAFADTFAEQS